MIIPVKDWKFFVESLAECSSHVFTDTPLNTDRLETTNLQHYNLLYSTREDRVDRGDREDREDRH